MLGSSFHVPSRVAPRTDLRGVVVLATALLVTLAGSLSPQIPERGAEGGRPSTVAGRVLDHESGVGVGAAVVSLGPLVAGSRGPGTRATDDEGAFRFVDVPPGRYLVTVTSLGYRALTDTLEVDADSEVRVAVRLSARPIALEPLVVTARRRPAFMGGFDERRAKGSSHAAFFDRDEIEEANPRVLSEMFTTVPGVEIRRGGLSDSIVVQGDPTTSRACRPDLFVNGNLTVVPEGFGVDDLFPPRDVEAVELYTILHDVPSRFRGPSRCGSLLVWLREEGEGERPASWMRWLAGLVALGATVLLAR